MFKKWLNDIKKDRIEYDSLPYFQKKILSYINNISSFTYIFTFILGILLGYIGGHNV